MYTLFVGMCYSLGTFFNNNIMFWIGQFQFQDSFPSFFFHWHTWSCFQVIQKISAVIIHCFHKSSYIFFFSLNFLQAATILAKQLVNLRKQKTKSYAMGSKITSIGHQQKVKKWNAVKLVYRQLATIYFLYFWS